MDHPGYKLELPVSIIAVYKTILIHDGGIKIKQLDDAVFVLKGSGQVTETQIVLFQARTGHATDNQKSLYLIRGPLRHKGGNSVF